MPKKFLCGRRHDTLPDSKGNKTAPEACGIVLQVQLYGRAKDLHKAIPVSKIRPLEGAHIIVETLFKQDPLSVVSDVFQDFLSLLGTKRKHNESFKKLESGFGHRCPV